MFSRQIASYRLERLLGQGGMSRVYLGRHQCSGRLVAIKVACLRSQDPHGMRRAAEHFEREAQSLVLLQHCRQVVDILELGQLESGRPYLVLELVDGQNLEHELDTRGPIAPHAASAMVSQVGAALQAAHDLGIAHLDVKPQNVVVRRDRHPELVLLDFGIARQTGQRPVRAGWIEGSPLFMAPEQLVGDDEQLGPAADMFALGTLAYLMLSGKLPFEIQPKWSNLRVISARLQKPMLPVPLANRAPWLPAQLCVLVDSCLATDPIARPSALAFSRAFAAVAHSTGDSIAHELGQGLHLALAPTLLCRPSATASAPRSAESATRQRFPTSSTRQAIRHARHDERPTSFFLAQDGHTA